MLPTHSNKTTILLVILINTPLVLVDTLAQYQCAQQLLVIPLLLILPVNTLLAVVDKMAQWKKDALCHGFFIVKLFVGIYALKTGTSGNIMFGNH